LKAVCKPIHIATASCLSIYLTNPLRNGEPCPQEIQSTYLIENPASGGVGIIAAHGGDGKLPHTWLNLLSQA
jgi:hypothetical protein